MGTASHHTGDEDAESPLRALYLALLVAVLIRLAWAALVPVIPVSDSAAYDAFAQNLATGNGFGWKPNEPTAFFAPGAAFIYAAFYVLFGHSYWPIIALHVLVSVATVILTWSLTNTWFGPRAANFSAWFLALWPSQIMFVTVLATELLFTFLLLTILWVWTRKSLNIWFRGLFLGPVLALTALIRPHALLLPGLLFLERLVRTRQWLTTIGSLTIAGLVMLAIIEPWALRNERIFGERVLVAANFGVTLWMGNNPRSSGAYMPVPDDVSHLNDAQRNNELKRRAIEFIKADPIGFLERSAMRLVKTHGWETINVVWNIEGIKHVLGSSYLVPLKAVSTAYWYAVLIGALAGIVLLLRQDGLIRVIFHPAVLLWGYFAAIHAVILSQDRYHFISIPMIASLAGFAFASALYRYHDKTKVTLDLTR